jgi:hypothetical protein
MQEIVINGVDVPERTFEVTAIEGSTAVFGPMLSTEGKWESQLLGRIIYRDYERDRRLRVPVFVDIRGKEHRLGKATKAFQLVNHNDSVQPFLDRGFVIRKLFYRRMGVDMFAILSHPDHTIEDGIAWDKPLYPTAGVTGNRMEMAVAVRSSLRVGKSILIEVGFFRTVCTNGLVVKSLGLGSLRVSHKDWKPEGVLKFIDETGLKDQTTWVPPQFPSSTLPMVTGALYNFLNGKADDVIGSFPGTPISRLATGIQRIPDWISKGMINQLALLTASGQPSYNLLDVLNMFTNVAHTRTDADQRIYSFLDRWIQPIIGLVQLSMLMSTAETFQARMLESSTKGYEAIANPKKTKKQRRIDMVRETVAALAADGLDSKGKPIVITRSIIEGASVDEVVAQVKAELEKAKLELEQQKAAELAATEAVLDGEAEPVKPTEADLAEQMFDDTEPIPEDTEEEEALAKADAEAEIAGEVPDDDEGDDEEDEEEEALGDPFEEDDAEDEDDEDEDEEDDDEKAW